MVARRTSFNSPERSTARRSTARRSTVTRLTKGRDVLEDRVQALVGKEMTLFSLMNNRCAALQSEALCSGSVMISGCPSFPRNS